MSSVDTADVFSLISPALSVMYPAKSNTYSLSPCPLMLYSLPNNLILTEFGVPSSLSLGADCLLEWPEEESFR